MLRQKRTPAICMIAYTDYQFDARVRREAETLAENGFRVLCLTPRDGNGCQSRRLRGVEVRELNVPKYQGKSTRRYVSSYLNFLWKAFWACNALLREGVDAVHVHNLPDFLIFAAVIPRLAGKKLVLDIHDSVPETFACKFPRSSPWLFRALCLEERFSTLLAHRVICVNHPQRDKLVARGLRSSKSFISINAPDHRIFATRPYQENGHPGFRLIYHGTMAKRLGVDLIIRAVAALRGRIPGIELHLWGNGDDLNAFRHLAQELDAEEAVHFKPEGVPLEKLSGKLVDMDLGVVGNRRNIATELMLPVKLLEYVALKIPAVAPRLPAIEHYFSDDMISYYTPGDTEALAEAILGLYHDRARRRGQAEQAYAFVERYGWEKQEVGLVNLYRSLLKG